ncbi:heme peroxidase [Gymnopus androsaceus JB14]|uniref:Peroxidase n=1 Tax=Gymnopus androsaceus JB14 TaxID=1447944 RepID=A0A6A4GRV1_9AGAR|nr:heme peroxidase [Gymnopus androsaceus JB14]
MSQLFQFLVISSTLAGYYAQSVSNPTFQWPNTLLKYADKQLFEGQLSELVSGCPPRENTTIPAQWVRLAYHDMATYDVSTGAGGLDASIQYELNRGAQNIGEGMPQTLSDFNSDALVTPFFGMADVIALGTVFAVSSCGGPFIPYSAGRVDATEGGPATVPEPQQDLATHIQLFQQQGFNQTEMIGLVACGHTLGGVRQEDFPTIVTEDLGDTDVATFDTTPGKFDNTIVSQYLGDTTQDVLIVGSNVTTKSDLRIFSSDGNRMLNTVPSTVSLTDPITEPFNYVINDPLLSYQNTTFILLTALRVLHPTNTSPTVTMFWGRSGGRFYPLAFNEIGIQAGVTPIRYSFKATIDATSSISNFWFEVNNNDGSDPIIVDNGGTGFVLEQDPALSLFVDIDRSEGVVLLDSNTEFFRIVVAVLGGAASASTATLTAFTPISTATAPPFLPTTTLINLILDDSNPPEGGFIFFTGNVSNSVTYLDVSATVDDTTYTVQNFDVNAAAQFLTFVEISS